MAFFLNYSPCQWFLIPTVMLDSDVDEAGHRSVSLVWLGLEAGILF